MALNQYISVKVCGNPDSNSGFVPILLFNSPSFAVEDQFYVGFDNCSYFYTIKTTKSQTIYKLVKNNVRSYGAARAGSLVIAFSIPKNYKLDGGYTPYDVLGKLKNEFLKMCMTCKDSIRETYEYNSGRIDQHVLDEVSNEFTISPYPCPNREMNPNSPIGYLVRSDSEIEKLFHDINYPEFDNFSEVIVAESVSQTSYTLINNIQIPRPKSYAIYVDGVFKGTCSDLNQTITASSQKSSLCYENKSVDFTIQNLIDGDVIPLPGIEIDKANEKITVSTQGWATPKRRRIEIKIVPNEFEHHFLLNRDLLKVETTFGAINIEQDLSFTLVGEQIAQLSKDHIWPVVKPNKLYTMFNYSVSSNELRIELKKTKPQSDYNKFGDSQQRNTHQESNSGLQCVNISPVVDVQILVDKFLELSNQQTEITMRLMAESQNGKKKSYCSQRVLFSRFKSGPAYEGHFFVPKNYHYSIISFSLQDNLWESDMIDVNKDSISLTDKDFHVIKKKGAKWNNTITKSVIYTLIALTLGLIIGYCLHNPIVSLFSHDKREAIIDPVVGPVDYDISRSEAHAFLEKVGSRLMDKDVSFMEINDFYEYYSEHNITLQECDEDYSGGKVCRQIRDYFELSQYISNGNIESIKDAINRYNSRALHVFPKHAELVMLILKDDRSKENFMNNYSKITRFDNIEENIKYNNDDEDISYPTSKQSVESPEVTSNRNPSTKKTANSSTKTTTEKKHWDCEVCKKAGKTGYRYDNQEQYNKHLKSHQER